MKRTGIHTALAMLLAVLLLFSGCHTVQTETSDEPTQIPTTEKDLALPDVSFMPPQEEQPPVQSQTPVESKPTPWAIVKVASELPLLTPAPTKTVTLPDKTVTAAYTGKGYREWTNTTPLYTYEADDGDVLHFDAVGGELVFYGRDKKLPEEEEPVSLAEAWVVAETFARKHIDLSLYKPTSQETMRSGEHWFQYVRYIGDMPTQDIINIHISPTGVLLLYRSNPHLFDCIQIGTVDKEALRQRVEEVIGVDKEDKDYAFLKISDGIIGLNDQGQPCVKYDYYYDRNDGRMIGITTAEILLTE